MAESEPFRLSRRQKNSRLRVELTRNQIRLINLGSCDGFVDSVAKFYFSSYKRGVRIQF